MPIAIMKIQANDIQLNDCFEVAGVGVRVRYIRWDRSDIENNKSHVSLDLHREDDPRHPLFDNTIMQLRMYTDEEIEVRRNV